MINWFASVWYVRSIIEIVTLWYIFHTILAWISIDQKRPLTTAVVCYWSGALVSSFLGLLPISTLLINSAPLAAMVFVLVHERTLQKSFITHTQLATIDTAGFNNHTLLWPTAIIRSCLYTLNNGLSCTIVIERRNALTGLLDSEWPCRTAVTEQILMVYHTSSLYNPQQALWITDHGTLVSYTAHPPHKNSIPFEARPVTVPAELEYYLALTIHTDAIVLWADPSQRTFTILVAGTAITNQTAERTVTLLHQLTDIPYTRTRTGEIVYESNKKSSSTTETVSQPISERSSRP